MADGCINCGDPDTERYELPVRDSSHDEVPLCSECHSAIRRELDDTA